MTPLSVDCSWQAAFAPLSRANPCVGYLTDFEGLGLASALRKDLLVYTPFNQTSSYAPLAVTQGRANVVAAIRTLAWGGGEGDPLKFSCYLSGTNATLLKQVSLKNSAIQSLGFCVVQFDPEYEVWFEAFFPLSPLRTKGELATNQGGSCFSLTETSTPIPASSPLYGLTFEASPAPAGSTVMVVAASSAKRMEVSWGRPV